MRLPRFLRDAFALTFASGVVTVPASAALFAQLSLVSPWANALASPLFALVCTGGLVAALAALAVPAAASAAVGLAGAAARVLAALVHALAGVPFASVPVGAPVVPLIAASALAVFLLWRFGRALAGARCSWRRARRPSCWEPMSWPSHGLPATRS